MTLYFTYENTEYSQAILSGAAYSQPFHCADSCRKVTKKRRNLRTANGQREGGHSRERDPEPLQRKTPKSNPPCRTPFLMRLQPCMRIEYTPTSAKPQPCLVSLMSMVSSLKPGVTHRTAWPSPRTRVFSARPYSLSAVGREHYRLTALPGAGSPLTETEVTASGAPSSGEERQKK